MQVILLRDVAGVGQKGSVKNVSDGYALNFLIPNRLAEMATKEKMQTLHKEQAATKAEMEVREKEWTALVKKLEGQTLHIKANASEQGHLYEKISGEHVAKVIEKELKVTLPQGVVQPKMAIKQTGEWPVEIRLGEHKATITVSVIT
ncbi:MAG: 50S ribosomal protein L9 [Patescibacteria group bacterium]